MVASMVAAAGSQTFFDREQTQSFLNTPANEALSVCSPGFDQRLQF
jgi:hypothetical protein